MDKTKTVKTRKTPTPAFAVISFLVIVAVLVALINLGVDTTMSVFIAALIAVVIALLLDIPWADVERTLLRVVSDCIPTFLIVIERINDHAGSKERRSGTVPSRIRA